MAGLGHRQDRGVMLPPLDEIDGFMVRPGFYNSEGAVPTARGVSFTIHSVGATGCTLLLFRPQEKEPYARLKYPEAYQAISRSVPILNRRLMNLNTRFSWTDRMMSPGGCCLTRTMCCWIRLRRQ